MNIFKAIGLTLESTVSVVTTTANVANKTVGLVDKELDIMHADLDKRIVEAAQDLPVIKTE